MSPFLRYLGLSIAFLLLFAAGAFFAQNWLFKESARLEAEAVQDMRTRMDAYVKHATRPPEQWTKADFAAAEQVLGLKFGEARKKGPRERDMVFLDYTVAGAQAGGQNTALVLHLRAPMPLYGRATLLRDRMFLALLLFGGLLSASLLFLILLRLPRREENYLGASALAEQGRDMQSLLHLAKTSVDREQALASERAERERTAQDLLSNQQLLSQALEERIRLGRDLHDGLIQNLYSAGLTLEAARARLHQAPDEAAQAIDQSLATLNKSIAEVRSFIQGLSRDALRSSGFKQALQSLAEELRGPRDVSLDFRIDDQATSLLTLEQGRELLQICREAISNGLRHGKASTVAVYLGIEDAELALLVRDNGLGFELNKPASGGHGLANMEARAKKLGARWDLQSKPGAGTVIRLFVPILEESPA